MTVKIPILAREAGTENYPSALELTLVVKPPLSVSVSPSFAAVLTGAISGGFAAAVPAGGNMPYHYSLVNPPAQVGIGEDDGVLFLREAFDIAEIRRTITVALEDADGSRATALLTLRTAFAPELSIEPGVARASPGVSEGIVATAKIAKGTGVPYRYAISSALLAHAGALSIDNGGVIRQAGILEPRLPLLFFEITAESREATLAAALTVSVAPPPINLSLSTTSVRRRDTRTVIQEVTARIAGGPGGRNRSKYPFIFNVKSASPLLDSLGHSSRSQFFALTGLISPQVAAFTVGVFRGGRDNMGVSTAEKSFTVTVWGAVFVRGGGAWTKSLAATVSAGDSGLALATASVAFGGGYDYEYSIANAQNFPEISISGDGVVSLIAPYQTRQTMTVKIPILAHETGAGTPPSSLQLTLVVKPAPSVLVSPSLATVVAGDSGLVLATAGVIFGGGGVYEYSFSGNFPELSISREGVISVISPYREARTLTVPILAHTEEGNPVGSATLTLQIKPPPP